MNTLSDLINEVGEGKARQFMMEYMMISLSKAMKYDEVVDALDDSKCTADNIRRILADDGEME